VKGLVIVAEDRPGSYRKLPRIDTSVPHSARFWNYLVGGKDNFKADRDAAEKVLAVLPVMGLIARSARHYLGRVVRYLAGEAGIRQFLDIGTGIPTASNTHEVAQSIAPQARIVYVDKDPIVLAHARALLTSTPDGETDYIEADIGDPERILREAARTLDFSQPVAIMLLGVLNFVADTDEAVKIVAQLLAAVPSGSYLAIYHPASDLDPSMRQGQRVWNQAGGDPITIRSRDEVARFLVGLELLEPGIVTMPEWRPDGDVPGDLVPIYAAVARKK
jgi:hypothetical protein